MLSLGLLYKIVVLVLGTYYIIKFVRYLIGVLNRLGNQSAKFYDENKEDILDRAKHTLPQREELTTALKSARSKLVRVFKIMLVVAVVLGAILLYKVNFIVGIGSIV